MGGLRVIELTLGPICAALGFDISNFLVMPDHDPASTCEICGLDVHLFAFSLSQFNMGLKASVWVIPQGGSSGMLRSKHIQGGPAWQL